MQRNCPFHLIKTLAVLQSSVQMHASENWLCRTAKVFNNLSEIMIISCRIMIIYMKVNAICVLVIFVIMHITVIISFYVADLAGRLVARK